MKVFILLAIVCFASSLALPDPREIKNEIFSRFVAKVGAKHGHKLGFSVASDARFPVLPPLPVPDPLAIPDWSFSLPENDADVVLSASLKNGALAGLTSWTDDLRLNILTQRVTYSGDIKSLQLTGDQTFKSQIVFIVPLTSSANGRLLAQFEGNHFDVGFTLAVNLTTTRVYVKNVAINLGFDKAQLFAENAKVVDVDINWDFVNEHVKDYFDLTWAGYQPGLQNLLKEVLDEVVGQYTLAEIIEFIINIGKPKTTTTAAPLLS